MAKKDDEVFEYETVKVDFEAAHLIDSWDYELDGETYHVETGGSEVPADKADELVKASRSTGAPLQRV
jgi:hypothetical protein